MNSFLIDKYIIFHKTEAAQTWGGHKPWWLKLLNVSAEPE